MLANPCPLSTVGNRYGPREVISVGGGKTSSFHGGLDEVADTGTPVYAAEAGTVVANPYTVASVGPFAVTIRHYKGQGVDGTGYAHLSSRVVAVGQTVERGQLIGYVGAYGYATGPHLHFDVFRSIYAFQRIDPYPLIDWAGKNTSNPGSGTGTIQEDDMPITNDDAIKIAEHVRDLKFRDGDTLGQSIVQSKNAAARLELALANLGRVEGTGRFYKHGDVGVRLWVFVHPSGDFVRIRDVDTARLYKEVNGTTAVIVSGEALRVLLADLTDAGGRDLSAVQGSASKTTETTVDQKAEDDAADHTA